MSLRVSARGEPLIIAIFFIMRTKYDCNENNDVYEICLQSWSKKGLNITMIITINTLYRCNLKSKTIYSLLAIGTKYTCNHRKFIFARFKHIWLLSKDIASILGLLNIVITIVSIFIAKIASIFGASHKNNCDHMWFISI